MLSWTIFLITTAGIGPVVFPVDTHVQGAQDAFERGVALLHNFEYDQARQAFIEAERFDPSLAMAVWGEAMTYNHPLWNEQDLEGARAVLRRLDNLPLPSRARLRGFTQAVHFLYGAGDKRARDTAYAYAMESLYEQYPSDDEVSAFTALAVLGATEGERDFRAYMRGAAMVEEVFLRSPMHPGALHYMIHAYDDPIHAPLGLRAARIYNQIASHSPHALHMTSHIYVAVGAWDETVKANYAAWQLGKANNPTGNPALYTVHDLHALQWLVYGHLQKGEPTQALDLVREAAIIAEEAGTPMARWFYSLMRAHYIVDTHDWDSDLPAVDMSGVELSSRSADLYVNVLMHLYRHDWQEEAIQQAIAEVDALCRTVPPKAPDETNPDYYVAVTPVGVAAAKVVLHELRAAVADGQGNRELARAYLEEAVALEAQMPVSYGPPLPVKPAAEALADWLLNGGQPVEASKAYKDVLDRHAKRRHAVQGLRRSVSP